MWPNISPFKWPIRVSVHFNYQLIVVDFKYTNSSMIILINIFIGHEIIFFSDLVWWGEQPVHCIFILSIFIIIIGHYSYSFRWTKKLKPMAILWKKKFEWKIQFEWWFRSFCFSLFHLTEFQQSFLLNLITF